MFTLHKSLHNQYQSCGHINHSFISDVNWLATGKSQLEEWFPLCCSQGEDAETRDWHPVEQRKLRPMHPFCFSKARGSRKRHHVAVGSHVWLVGDRVDAFIQDGSELLFLKSCSDIDAWQLAGLLQCPLTCSLKHKPLKMALSS